MHEIPCHFGTESALVGIYTLAKDSESLQDDLPVVLLLNSGLLPNVGPYRLYVRLARHFGLIGFDSFRFDISGIGDSERRNDTIARDKQQIGDIQTAMDYLQSRYNKHQFVVMGICTGADNAHRAMLADKRIVGAVGIDGYYYKTPQYYYNDLLKRLLPRLFQAKVWGAKMKPLVAKFRKICFGKSTQTFESMTIPFRWKVPSRKKTAADYRTFIERDVSKLCIFTASWPYNYQEQHADAFPDVEFGSNLQVRFLKNAEHVFPLSQDRQLLTDSITGWLLERFYYPCYGRR